MDKNYTLACLTSLALISPGVLGQASRHKLEEVIVTATKRTENLQDVPIAVTGLSGGALENGIIENIADASRLVPNLKLNHGRDSGSQATIHIRGVGQSDEQGDPGVGVYVDGVYLARSYGSLLELFDLERIEVLRGPQGTLFGRNTIGGAISLVTKKPTAEPEFDLELGYGSFDHVFLKASGQTTLIEDTLFTRISLVSQDNTGYAENRTKDEVLYDKSSLAFRIATRAIISDNFEANLAVDWAHDKSNAPGALISAVDPGNGTYQFIEENLGPIGDYIVGGPAGVSVDSRPRRAFLDSSNDNDLESWGIALILDANLDAFDLKSITSFREIDNQLFSDLDGTPSLILDQRSEFSNWQFSQELQFTGESDNGDIRWMGGLYYFEEEQELPIAVEILPELAPLFGANLGFVRDVEQTTKSYAVFGSINYDLTDALTLTAGARYTQEKKTLEALRQTFSGEITFFEPGTNDDFDDFSPKLSLSYKVNDDILAYTSYSKGFKSGGFNSRAASEGQTQSYEPEELDSYEIGLKSRFMDDTVQLNIAAFYADYTDIQQQIFTTVNGSVISTVTNAAEATVAGIEVELTASPTDNFLINMSFGIIDAEFDEFEDELLGDLTGREFQDTPEFSANIGAEYRMSLSDNFEMVFVADYSYQSEVFFDPLNAEEIADNGYDVVNAKITLASQEGNYEISVFGKNLADEEYRVSGVNLLGADDFGYGLNYYGEPRTYGIRLKISL